MYKITKILLFNKKRTRLFTFYLAMALFIQPAIGQSANSINKVVEIKVENSNLLYVLNQLKQQSDYTFFYDREAIQDLKISSLSISKLSVPQALSRLRSMLPFRYEISNRKEVSIHVESANEFKKRIAQERPGKIVGRVIDDKGESLPSASIRVLGKAIALKSAADGTFQVNLDPGIYTIEVSYMGYQTKRITDIVIKPGANTPLNVLLTMSSSTLGEVTITSTYKKSSIEGLYARQKNNAAVSDGITAEQISRTPDNNTAQVLARVSGLQVSDNKYVVVRGLSERYNNVLLNGAMLPSSEPNRRNFAFDMVPSALLDRIVVNKTATPDLTGEFTGGLVQVETKDIPTENFLQLTIGTGYNSLSTGKEMIGLNRGENAWIGFASDVHKKPTGMTFSEYSKIQQNVESTAPPEDPNRQKMHVFLATMPENWTLKRYKAQPTQNYQLQLGRIFKTKNESNFGLVAALTYRNEQDIKQRHLYEIFAEDYSGNENSYATTLGGSLNLGYQIGKHKLALQNTYNRKFSDNMWKYSGVDADNNFMRSDSYTNVTVINQLFQSQISGEHKFTERNIKVDWLASTGFTDRDQPYSRVIARGNGTEEGLPKDYFGYSFGDNSLKTANLFYSELGEKTFNWAANITIPFQLFHLSQNIKTGYQGKFRTADFGANLYRIKAFNFEKVGMGTPYEQVLTKENFGEFIYLNNTDAIGRTGAAMGDNVEGYNGFQRLNSFYLMTDLNFFECIRLIGGMRAEKNDQNINDIAWSEEGWKDIQVNNKQTDWLPSINAIYAINDKINLRAAWYKTVARPDFRELSSFQYWDYEYFNSVSGRKLKTTYIQNADVRLEYYPSPGEIISLSAFYKKFNNPIELLVTMTSSSLMFEYYNLESALDKGFEVDFRKSLSFINANSTVLSNLYLSGNFTWLDAFIEFKEDYAVDEKGNRVGARRNRPLAGQSPYIINAGLMYTGDRLGFNAVYNRSGKRLILASSNRGIDEYEKPRDILDFQLSYKFLKQRKAEVKLNMSNLLNQEQIIYKNRFDVNNPFSEGNGASVEPYPDGNVEITKHLDPKGTDYNKDYDTVTRRYRFGSTYSLNFIYRF